MGWGGGGREGGRGRGGVRGAGAGEEFRRISFVRRLTPQPPRDMCNVSKSYASSTQQKMAAA